MESTVPDTSTVGKIEAAIARLPLKEAEEIRFFASYRRLTKTWPNCTNPTVTDVEAEVVAAWKEAVADLGVRFTSPFFVTLPDGRQHEYLGLVHDFGRRIGTLISVLDEPSRQIFPSAGAEYFRSALARSYRHYDRQYFIDTLDDWQFFGPENERPVWYSGKSWS